MNQAQDLAGLSLPVKHITVGVERMGPCAGLFAIKLLLGEGCADHPLSDLLFELQEDYFRKYSRAALLSVGGVGVDPMQFPALYHLHREMKLWSTSQPEVERFRSQFQMNVHTNGQHHNAGFANAALMLQARSESIRFITHVQDKSVTEQMRSFCKHWVYLKPTWLPGELWDWRSLPWKSDAYLVTHRGHEEIVGILASRGMRYQMVTR